jgi:hypothetical protein
MTRRRFFTLIALLITVANPPARIFAQTDEKSAVEGQCGSSNNPSRSLISAKPIHCLRPMPAWIEEASSPALANEWSQWWQDAKAARLRMTNRPHDLEIYIHGDVAWATVFVDTTIEVDNDAARALTRNKHPNEREWVTHAFETEVLLKTPQGWKIVLGHTSLLPKE